MVNAVLVGGRTSAPLDEDEARSTIEPVRNDGPAEQKGPPDWNELETDSSGQLVGLSPRVAGSETKDSVQYGPWWAHAAGVNHNEIVDNQVSSSGTAAAREMAGQQGHGTMQYAEGIEPVLREGAAYGETYFASHALAANEGSGPYMTPPIQDDWAKAVAQSAAEEQSRQAFQGSQYVNLLGAM